MLWTKMVEGAIKSLADGGICWGENSGKKENKK